MSLQDTGTAQRMAVSRAGWGVEPTSWQELKFPQVAGASKVEVPSINGARQEPQIRPLRESSEDLLLPVTGCHQPFLGFEASSSKKGTRANKLPLGDQPTRELTMTQGWATSEIKGQINPLTLLVSKCRLLLEAREHAWSLEAQLGPVSRSRLTMGSGPGG